MVVERLPGICGLRAEKSAKGYLIPKLPRKSGGMGTFARSAGAKAEVLVRGVSPATIAIVTATTRSGPPIRRNGREVERFEKTLPAEQATPAGCSRCTAARSLLARTGGVLLWEYAHRVSALRESAIRADRLRDPGPRRRLENCL